MTDYTTIQPHPVLPELAQMQAENIALSKSNTVLKWIIGGLAFIGLAGSIYNKIKNGSLKLRVDTSLSKDEASSAKPNTGM